MKKLLIFIALLCGAPSLTTAQAVVNAGGGIMADHGVEITYSIGEPVISDWLDALEVKDQAVAPAGERAGQPLASAVQLRVYPNPADNWLMVETAYTGFQSYQVFGLHGAEAASGAFDYTPIPMNGLSAGAYLLQLRAADTSFIKTIKFIKQ